MRRAIVVLVVSVLGASLMGRIAHAQSSNLSDGFDSIDKDNDYFHNTTWSKGDHKLGRSYLSPNNVGATDDNNLEIKLPANSGEGGEIKSQNTYKYGSYTARIRVPDAPSSITGFFLYEPPGLRQRDRHRDL